MRTPIAISSFVIAAVCALSAQSSAPLKIVVLEGEGGVNIIQQKTAVRPLVEVLNRNNVPVAGASVTFTIGGGRQGAAFAGGAQTLTVTTNAAGQAAASGLNAVSSGALVATQAISKQSGDDSGDSRESFDSYNGTMSGQLALISVATNPQGQPTSCTRSHVVTGPVRIDLRPGIPTAGSPRSSRPKRWR